ncbi:hypothetical protein EU527_19355 [Candidatus Thorarchaeota archaeon]|nr:MAG: hypothetical protein EU527_19355 [Candidatus Thorarchaeota archaeon]
MELLRPFIDRAISLLREYYIELIALSAVLLHLAPYFVLGQNVLIGIHDTFDSYIVWYKILSDSGMIFADSSAIVPLIIGGLPRISFGSEFNVLIWMFVFFEPFTAYVLNLVAMHIVGFLGMYLLLKTHFLKDEKYRILVLGVAVCFAILPLWPPAGLSVPSLPLALYAFLNIRANKFSKWDLLVLILIPFYSSLIFSYIFFLSLIGFVWLWDVIKTHNLNQKFLMATVLMCIEFLLIEYRFVLALFLGEGFTSHRVEFRLSDLDLHDSLLRGFNNFIMGQYHVNTLHSPVILFTIGFAVFIILSHRFDFAKKPAILIGIGGLISITTAFVLIGFNQSVTQIYKITSIILLGPFYPISILITLGLVGIAIVFLLLLIQKSERFRMTVQENYDILKQLTLILVAAAIISLWYGLWSSSFILPFKEQSVILRSIQFSRFHWLHPLLWYLLFALSLSVVWKKIDFKINKIELGKVIAIMLILLQLAVLLPYSWNIASSSNSGHENITYKEFFAEDLFQKIENDIGLPQDSYRVLCIGFHPSISQFNGFYTLDGYSNNYPLEYKHQFRNIIGYELAKDAQLQDYFDNWGSRCYVLIAELGTNFFCTKDKDLVVNNLELNITAMHEMNVSYIFSAVNVTNYAANSLQFSGLYQDAISAWDIYLYELL